MNITNLNNAISEFSRIKTGCENSKMSVKPILVYNKEKSIYEITFMNEVYIEKFESNKYEIIKK